MLLLRNSLIVIATRTQQLLILRGHGGLGSWCPMRTRGHGLWGHRLRGRRIGGLRSLRGHRLLIGPHLRCLGLMEVPIVGVVQGLRPILWRHLL